MCVGGGGGGRRMCIKQFSFTHNDFKGAHAATIYTDSDRDASNMEYGGSGTVHLTSSTVGLTGARGQYECRVCNATDLGLCS